MVGVHNGNESLRQLRTLTDYRENSMSFQFRFVRGPLDGFIVNGEADVLPRDHYEFAAVTPRNPPARLLRYAQLPTGRPRRSSRGVPRSVGELGAGKFRFARTVGGAQTR